MADVNGTSTSGPSKDEKEKVKETAHRDGVKIEFHEDGSRSAVMERRQQMFGICTAIRQQLWDNLDKGAIPVRIEWRLIAENGKKRKKVAPKDDIKT